MEKNITVTFNSGFDFEMILVHLEMALNSRFLAMTNFRVHQTSLEPSILSQRGAFTCVIFLTTEQKDEILLLFSF